jgi:CHASE2 domain-containing sensor protein
MGDSRVPAGAWRVILGIMLAILAWGLFHALGAWRLNHDIRRTFVVLGCVAAFLGFWGVLLAAKWRRLHERG